MRALFLGLVFVCVAAVSHAFAAQFDDYWYSGRAEITSYELSQARYGAKHPGYAVLIFVTEDFSRSKHVKLDNPSLAGRDAVKVLKLNLVKKFNTGIYRYSTMSSVFAPVSGADLRPLKVTLSSQEWCGHVFSQFNLRGRYYEGKTFSYFESEGDESFKVESVFLEDEIWTRARIAPQSLPTGRISIVPGLLITRLLHTPTGVERADAKISSPAPGITRYSLFFPKTDRVFEMDFETDFPHKIVSWRENYRSGWGKGAKRIETVARRKKTIFSDYWNKNSPPDARMRRDLGIEP
ncbi:MAG: hypothetical protein GKS04_00775 [Candidatus Mycalebacterium zealandia]|nr:MAG: hypothetical protein GKS04_00775 [Candidatus Mycalebacterium zealandia]